MAEELRIDRLAYIVASELNGNLTAFAWTVTNAAPFACEIQGRPKMREMGGELATVDISSSGSEINEQTKLRGMIVSRNLYTGQTFRTSTDTRDIANRIALKIERAVKTQMGLLP